MEYTEIVLKLVNDMLKLEKKVEHLQECVTILSKEKQKDMQNDTNNSITKKMFSKNETISLLKESASKQGIEINKASRKEGGGVLIKHDGHSSTGLLKSSRNYVQDKQELDFRAWHTLPLEALENYSSFIFTVENGVSIDIFVFTQSELKSYLKDKRISQSNNESIYHMYLSKKANGDYVDLRDGEKLVNRYHNNWQSLKKI